MVLMSFAEIKAFFAYFQALTCLFFVLHAQVKLTEAEAAAINKYKMSGEIIYSKDRLGYSDARNETAGGMMKNLAASGMQKALEG